MFHSIVTHFYVFFQKFVMLVFDNVIFYLFNRDLVVTNGTAICILVLLDQRYLQYIESFNTGSSVV